MGVAPGHAQGDTGLQYGGLSKEAEAELEQLYDEYGELTEDIVLEQAKKRSSTLHSYFEWNDSEAARLFRRLQAKSVIVSVKVTVVHPDGTKSKHRVYESTFDPESEEPIPAFQRREDIEASNPDLLKRSMEREWKGFYNRWKGTRGLWSMIDRTRETKQA